jgi:hypothetical protein
MPIRNLLNANTVLGKAPAPKWGIGGCINGVFLITPPWKITIAGVDKK